MADMICLTEARHSKGGGAAISPLPRTEQPVQAVETLTARQQEILRLLAKWFYYKEIAKTLGISHSTVRAHLHSVYQKLAVKSRARAVIKFQEHAAINQARNLSH